MLFLNSQEFRNGICYALNSPSNFQYVIERKLRENLNSQERTKGILEIINYSEKEVYNLKNFLFSGATISLIDLFAHFLNTTFESSLVEYSIKKFYRDPSRIDNPGKKFLISAFRNHSLNPIFLSTGTTYIKIKALIITCSYVSSEPVESRGNLSDMHCIVLAFINMKFPLINLIFISL